MYSILSVQALFSKTDNSFTAAQEVTIRPSIFQLEAGGEYI